MDEEQNNQENESKGRWPKWWILFPILLVLSLAANAFLFYKYYSATHNSKGQSYEELYKDAIAKHEIEKAELNNELADLKLQLENAILSNTSLLGYNDSLKLQLDEKTIRIAQLIRQSSYSNPAAIKKAREEIESLKNINALLRSENDSLIINNSELIARILESENNYNESKLISERLEQEKISVAKKIDETGLSVSDLKVVGIRKKGSKEEETYKASKSSRLEISFALLPNELVSPGDKEINIRIIGTSGEVLTENNPDLTDSDKLITMKKDINYQNKLIKVKYDYSQKAKYKKGTYSIELYHKERLMGRSSFILR
ncbi:MAG: hypothetical protein H6605_00800 [Flavobacteriales bacterium]|nr:hypothetical protein [Flavobacteriales bacterium]